MPYTNINKPGAQSYTNINTAKPSYDEIFFLYDDPNQFYDGFDVNMYTNINKPGAQSYTNIAKPT